MPGTSLSFELVMGVFALGVFWINALLISVSALLEAIRLRRRIASFGELRCGRVTRGLGDGDVLARYVVEQRGRARPKSDGPILFHDRDHRGECFGGEIEIDTTGQVVAAGDHRVWIDPARVLRSATRVDDWEHAIRRAPSAKGLLRDVSVELRTGDRVWLGAGVVSDIDPAAWTHGKVRLAVGFALLHLLGAAAISVVVLWPPAFGTVSTLGAFAALIYWLAFSQPFGVAVRDACRPPDRAYVRGTWRGPPSQAATA